MIIEATGDNMTVFDLEGKNNRHIYMYAAQGTCCSIRKLNCKFTIPLYLAIISFVLEIKIQNICSVPINRYSLSSPTIKIPLNYGKLRVAF